MKQKVNILCLLICCLTASSAIAQQVRNISKQGALSIVKMSFRGQDVDYYLCENAVLQVSSLSLGGTILLRKSLPIGTKEMRLDATSLSSGIYILYYSIDGQITDSQKFNKE